MSAPAASGPADEMMQRLVEAAGAAREPAADMADLAAVVRSLLAVEARRDAHVRLGGGLFDIVITSSDARARFVVDLMDEIQGGCGPVIEDPGNSWLYWLVPPGSADLWAPHAHSVCVGAPHTITLPSLDRTEPPGPFWHRPMASDRLVPMRPLHQALRQIRPEPTPPASLTGLLNFPL
ncbi:hypothetical protein [Streptomyces parvulus]